MWRCRGTVCICWIARWLRRVDDDDETVAPLEVDLDREEFEAAEGGSALERSSTFIDAAEPGMRLTSVGALRKSDPLAAF